MPIFDYINRVKKFIDRVWINSSNKIIETDCFTKEEQVKIVKTNEATTLLNNSITIYNKPNINDIFEQPRYENSYDMSWGG